MRYLKSFEMMDPSLVSGRTFLTTMVSDLCWLNVNQVITMIQTTFPGSKLVDRNGWEAIVESPWKILPVDELKMMTDHYSDVIKNNKFKIYFHIYVDDYKIIRGKNSDIDNFLDFLESEKGFNFGNRLPEKGNSYILRKDNLPYISWSYGIIPSGEEAVTSRHSENDHYFLNSLGCNEATLSEKNTIAYFSNLLIGSDLEIRDKEFIKEILY